MKKITSFILTLVLLVTFSIIPVSAEKPVLTGLSEIGSVEVMTEEGYSFRYSDQERKIGMYEKNMEERDLKYFLDVFSDDNLICVDSDIKEEITYTSPDWPEEGTFEFYAKGEKYFVFNFNREKVLVSVAAIDVYYQGWFEFKDNKIFDELMEYLDEIQKRNEKDDDQMGTEPDDSDKDSEEDRFDNQIEISDFKIEYDGIVSNLKGFEFNWGVCSYIREGETEPVYVCYYGAKNEPDYKAFPISEIIEENNTVVLSNMKRFVLVKDGVIDGVEFDNKMTLPHWYRIQVDVADDMTA